MTFVPIPARTYRIAHTGNSIVAGTYLPDGTRYADLLQAKLGSRFSTVVGAYPGLPTYNPDTPDYSVIGRYLWDSYPGGSGVYQSPPTVSIAMGWEVTNEIRGIAGATADSALAHWAEEIALLRATGYYPIYSFTALPTTLEHATELQLQYILEANMKMLLNPSGIYGDRVLDAARLPQLLDPTSSTYYLSDHLHPSPDGHAVLADFIYHAMMSDHLA